MARNWKKMSKEEEDKKRQETIDKAIETMKRKSIVMHYSHKDGMLQNTDR